MNEEPDLVILELPLQPMSVQGAVIVSLVALGLDAMLWFGLNALHVVVTTWMFAVGAPLSILLGFFAHAARREAFGVRRRRRDARERVARALESRHIDDIGLFCQDFALLHGASRSDLGAITFEKLNEAECRIGRRLPRVWLFDARVFRAAIEPISQPNRLLYAGTPSPLRVENDLFGERRRTALRYLPLVLVLFATGGAVGVYFQSGMMGFGLLGLGSLASAILVARANGGVWWIHGGYDAMSYQKRTPAGDVLRDAALDPAETFVMLTVRIPLANGVPDWRVCDWNFLSAHEPILVRTTGVRGLDGPWGQAFFSVLTAAWSAQPPAPTTQQNTLFQDP